MVPSYKFDPCFIVGATKVKRIIHTMGRFLRVLSCSSVLLLCGCASTSSYKYKISCGNKEDCPIKSVEVREVRLRNSVKTPIYGLTRGLFDWRREHYENNDDMMGSLEFWVVLSLPVALVADTVILPINIPRHYSICYDTDESTIIILAVSIFSNDGEPIIGKPTTIESSPPIAINVEDTESLKAAKSLLADNSEQNTYHKETLPPETPSSAYDGSIAYSETRKDIKLPITYTIKWQESNNPLSVDSPVGVKYKMTLTGKTVYVERALLDNIIISSKKNNYKEILATRASPFNNEFSGQIKISKKNLITDRILGSNSAASTLSKANNLQKAVVDGLCSGLIESKYIEATILGEEDFQMALVRRFYDKKQQCTPDGRKQIAEILGKCHEMGDKPLSALLNNYIANVDASMSTPLNSILENKSESDWIVDRLNAALKEWDKPSNDEDDHSAEVLSLLRSIGSDFSLESASKYEVGQARIIESRARKEEIKRKKDMAKYSCGDCESQIREMVYRHRDHKSVSMAGIKCNISQDLNMPWIFHAEVDSTADLINSAIDIGSGGQPNPENWNSSPAYIAWSHCCSFDINMKDGTISGSDSGGSQIVSNDNSPIMRIIGDVYNQNNK